MVQERVVRAAGYTGAKKEISVWDAVVHSRRAADQVASFIGKDMRQYFLTHMLTIFVNLCANICISCVAIRDHDKGHT